MNHLTFLLICKLLVFATIIPALMAGMLQKVFADESLTPTSTGVAFCGSSAGADIDMSACSSAMAVPSGSSGTRPGTAWGGMVRYNTDNADMETYYNGSWQQLFPAIPRSFNNVPSHTIQTVAASANGFQLSTTRDAIVSYGVLITVTASISSGQSGYVVLEICPTNSATAANWVEINRVSAAQTYTLALALQGILASGGVLDGIVPAGYYARMRSANVTGTPTYSFVDGQEVLQ